MSKLPTHLPRPTSLLARRPSLLPSRTQTTTSPSPYNSSTPTTISLHQSRAATFIPRPRRPYTFTQLVQLSDGSTFTVRSTSPTPLVRSAKDTRNHALWQPSDKSLKNVEVDEAGKLAAFRERFGRGFDLSAAAPAEDAAPVDAAAAKPAAGEDKAKAPDAAKDEVESLYDLGDLISGYAAANPIDQSKMRGDKRGQGNKK
ncbi:54S ribosomal protein L36, mitochondrial [Colletotrichum plurivorum]|uniref:54S ribosomal protein L36, mitochondrial n=1 Tax=Colletotrichum plurivorum TaxID=2175906 RepID=A0A8H6K898_9PEZI|nr:54S ribosomal protein L36, mitochondrial [Colletotrichum plurivorum]